MVLSREDGLVRLEDFIALLELETHCFRQLRSRLRYFLRRVLEAVSLVYLSELLLDAKEPIDSLELLHGHDDIFEAVFDEVHSLLKIQFRHVYHRLSTDDIAQGGITDAFIPSLNSLQSTEVLVMKAYTPSKPDVKVHCHLFQGKIFWLSRLRVRNSIDQSQDVLLIFEVSLTR